MSGIGAVLLRGPGEWRIGSADTAVLGVVGGGLLRAPGRPHPLTRGAVFRLGAGAECELVAEASAELLLLHLPVGADVLARADPLGALDRLPGPADRTTAALVTTEALARARARWRELAAALAEGSPHPAYCEALSLILLVDIVRGVGATMPGSGARHTAVQRAIGLLDRRLEQAWTLESLARAVGVAPAYLSRLFSADLALAPMAYLAHRRAERMATLLLETDLSVSEIGGRVGWSDPSHVSRQFRSALGSSPAEYRSRRGGVRAPSSIGEDRSGIGCDSSDEFD